MEVTPQFTFEEKVLSCLRNVNKLIVSLYSNSFCCRFVGNRRAFVNNPQREPGGAPRKWKFAETSPAEIAYLPVAKCI